MMQTECEAATMLALKKTRREDDNKWKGYLQDTIKDRSGTEEKARQA